MALKFRFRWIPFLAALIVAGVGFALGDWQTRRAAQKEAIDARMTERAQLPALRLGAQPPSLEELEFRQVIVRGRFVPQWNVFLDNRPHAGTAGFYVLTPFRLEDGTVLLVKRGWTPRDPRERSRLPAIREAQGEQEIAGLVRRDAGRVMQLGTPEPLRPGAIVQNATVAEFAEAEPWRMHDFVLEQTSDTGDGLVRDWPHPASGADKHRGYAFQWYGLAVAALIFFFVTGWTRGAK